MVDWVVRNNIGVVLFDWWMWCIILKLFIWGIMILVINMFGFCLKNFFKFFLLFLVVVMIKFCFFSVFLIIMVRVCLFFINKMCIFFICLFGNFKCKGIVFFCVIFYGNSFFMLFYYCFYIIKF